MNWRLYLRMIGASVESAERHGIHDTADFCDYLRNGRLTVVQGVGRKGFDLLCEAADYPLPEWDRRGRMVKTPGEVLLERMKKS